MYVSRNDYNRIMLNYEKALKDKKESLSLVQTKIYNNNPRLSEIDDEIKSLYLDSIKMSFSPSISNEKKEIEEKIESLKLEKKSIFDSLGISKDDLENQYVCNTCKDTGYIGNNMCTCLKKYFIDFTYSNSSLKEKFNIQNFNTFDLSFYSDELIHGTNLSYKDNMKLILNAAHDFCDNFNGKNNLFFYGQPGRGKTFLCNSIAKELLDKGYSVVYYSAANLFKTLSELTFNKKDDYSNQEETNTYIMDGILKSELLIIDDLGTEFITQLSVSQLFEIINERINRKKSTIISSNLNISNIRDTYSERISSRLIESYISFKFEGENIRIKKAYRQ